MEILSLQNRQDDGKRDAPHPPFSAFYLFPLYRHPGFRRLYETQVFMQKGSNLLIVFRNLDEYRPVFSMSLQALRRDSIVYNTKNDFWPTDFSLLVHFNELICFLYCPVSFLSKRIFENDQNWVGRRTASKERREVEE